MNIHKYNKALYYFKKALLIEQKNNNERGIEYGYANIGESLMQLKKYDSAQIYVEKALKLSIKNKRKDSKAIKFNLLGLLYQKQLNFEKSDSFYLKSIPIFEETKNIRYLSNSLINLGINYLHQNKVKLGLTTLESGLKFAKKLNSKENILLAYNGKSNYYSRIHNYKKAFEFHKLAIVFKDSIFNEASQKSIISSQVAYESLEKDKLISNLAKDNKESQLKADSNFKKLMYVGIISTLLLISLIVLFFLYRRNSDLEVQYLNNQLQNYVLQLNELRSSQKEENSKTTLHDNIEAFELSNRETDVLKLIVKGYNNIEISEELFISANTVKTHIKNIYTKLDVKNRIQAVKKISEI